MRKHPRLQTRIEGLSLTQQHKAADANVNNIMGRHIKNAYPGMPIGTPGVQRQPMFMDVSAIDFQEMLNKVTDMQTEFMRLPSKVRGRFRNDPYQLLRFTDDPKNRAECLRLGLVLPTEDELDLETAARTAAEAKVTETGNTAPKADPEAQPSYNAAPKPPNPA